MPEITKKQDHRREFVHILNELAEKDDKIIVLIPDVGFNYLDDPNNKFKVINTGVTEQSTTMIAVGLALEGFKPYIYSMINFVLFRPYEMVRNGIVHHKANVKLLGVKGSESYKFLGFSHNMTTPTEDFDACDNLGLEWRWPQENRAVREVILETYKSEKACYIRL